MEKIDLTKGSIVKAIFKLSVPIIGTSFVQMAYNMTDMIWIGRNGSESVAAVGTAGFFVWFGLALILISKIGAEVGVSQSLGRGNKKQARDFARNSLQLNFINAIAFSIMILLFKNQIMSFFNIENQNVVGMSLSYLSIITYGIPFMFITPVFSGIYNGAGDSKTPFIINTVGLILNIILDPVFIFGIGFFPKLGVNGAAIATIFSQFVVAISFLVMIKGVKSPFENFYLFRKMKIQYIKKIIKFGFPVAVQSASFTIIATVLARFIAKWGATSIAVQKVGTQIEALSWMTAGGISTAVSAFVGQNFGAKKWHRIYKGYFIGMGIASISGIFSTILLIFFPEFIFKIFINEAEAIREGVIYLKILGLSQLFMCIEITATGAFNGLGKTLPPAVIGVALTAFRIPMAYLLAKPDLLDLSGVWWSISLTSVVKGVVIAIWFFLLLYKNPEIGDKLKIKQFIYRYDYKYLRDKRSISGK